MKKLFISFLMSLMVPTAVFMQDIAAAQESRSYLVLPGDKIEGKVLGEEEFNFVTIVDDNGRFTLPYVNTEITAQCRTEREIFQDVVSHYSKYLKDPLISVAVTDRRTPAPVTVSGEVRTPQRVELRREARLLELISVSGGYTEDAGGTVQVFHTQMPLCADKETKEDWNKSSSEGNDGPSRLFSRAAMNGGDSDSNPVIYPGDIIIVDKADPVYLTGEVVQQTGVYIKEGGLSLTQALAMVGGVRQKAKEKDIKIYRRKGQSQQDRLTITVDLEKIKNGTEPDIMLEPYDIVEVDRAKDSIASRIFKIVSGTAQTAVTSIASSSGYRILY